MLISEIKIYELKHNSQYRTYLSYLLRPIQLKVLMTKRSKVEETLAPRNVQRSHTLCELCLSYAHRQQLKRNKQQIDFFELKAYLVTFDKSSQLLINLVSGS